MRGLTSFLATAAVVLVIPIFFVQPAEACLTCTSAQWCTSGADGSSCTIYEDPDGTRWCQFSLDCGIEQTMIPTDMSVAGTYASATGTSIGSEGTAGCNGYIVTFTEQHLASEAAGESIRI